MNAEARPLFVLGQRQLDQIGASMQHALAELSRSWWRDRALQLVGVSMWSETWRSASLKYLLRAEQGRWLGFLGADKAWLKLAEGWLGCDVPVGGPLVDTLEREFCLACFRSVVGADVVAVVLDHSTWSDIPASALRTGGGALVIELDVEGVPLTLLAPIDLWPPFATWQTPRSTSPLHEASKSLRESVVELEVRLAAARIPMTEIGTLAVGDFLNLEHDLSGRVRVLSAQASVELTAVLGQQGGCKAVRIEKSAGER